MGTFESARGGVWCLLTVWQYIDALRFPLQLQIIGAGAAVQWDEAEGCPGDDPSIRPHLEMMTGGGSSQRANKLRFTIEQALAAPYNRM